MKKVTSQDLQRILNELYPVDGSEPVSDQARYYRHNDDARNRFMLAQMIVALKTIEQAQIDIGTIALELKKIQASAPAEATAAAAPEGAAEEATVDGEEVELMPATQAVAGMSIPVPRPMASPMRAAAPVANGGGEVTVAPFQPASISAS